MKNFLKDLPLLLIALVLTVVLLFALDKFDCGKKVDMQGKLDREIHRNDSLISVIGTLRAARKDSLAPIIKYVQAGRENTDHEIEGIQNVTNIDSLIEIYKAAKKKLTTDSTGLESYDSTKALIGKDEIKFISISLLDYNYVKNIQVKGLTEQVGILTRMISDSDAMLLLKDSDIELLKQKVNDLLPGWWDRYKFYVGVVCGAVVAVLIKVL